jgi:hypothetical protein
LRQRQEIQALLRAVMPLRGAKASQLHTLTNTGVIFGTNWDITRAFVCGRIFSVYPPPVVRVTAWLTTADRIVIMMAMAFWPV